jgi:hypothetical protein
MTEALTERLQAAAVAIPIPDADRFAEGVLARVAVHSNTPTQTRRSFVRERPGAFAPTRRLALVGAIAAAAVLITVILPGPRRAVGRWFGFDAVRIERVPATETSRPPGGGAGDSSITLPVTSPPFVPQPSTTSGGAAPFPDLGPAVVPEVITAAGLPLPTPTGLGRPASLHLPTWGGGVQAVAIYPPAAGLPASVVDGVGAVVVVMTAQVDTAVFGKLVPESATVESFSLDGDQAVWIEGEPHSVMVFVDGDYFDETLRLATNTLILQRGDLLFRLEASISRAEAEAIARTWEPQRP